ncbi:hypothetical protein EYZ11_001221 [Aspergillus tanneri]|nr:hypothetical protein EYZ11_001221 [Aspergillus tanneri]
MFEELKPEKANNILGRRSLGYGSLRLLPKMTGIRPIVNLRRRMQLKSKWTTTGVQYLGPSINSTVAPIFNVLNYEKTRNPAQLGSCLYSVGEIHSRLKAFKEQMSQGSSGHTRQLPFYFVKLDIQSCFDTIPQQKLIHLVEKLVSEEAYHVTKYVEMRVQDEFSNIWPSQGSRQNKGVRKFVGRAAPAMKPQPLAETIESGGVSRRRNTVFVDTVAQKYYNTEDLLDLLNEHLRNNLVKFGKKFFRQRNGIPQGSVLSSLLCNLFYAEMEREKLGFLGCKEALLLRLVDDFLLITSNPTLAMRFLKVMVKGQPAYGITVNPAKSLVNFGAVVEGAHIPRLIDSSLFPYCGSLIDTRTLEVHKDHDRILEGGDSAAENLSNSLTVELARAPGHSFHRKVLASFKLLMHPMYLDTSHNSLPVVLSNLYANFVMTAMRMYRYMRALIGRRHPTPAVVIRVIRDLIQLSHRFVQAKRTPSRQVGEGDDSNSSSTSMVHGFQVQYLAAAAFRHVLGRKQTRYGAVLHWLDQIQRQARPKSNGKLAHLVQVVRKGNMLYGGWRY